MRGREICESGVRGKGLVSLPHDYEEEEYGFEVLDEDECLDITLTESYGEDATRNSIMEVPNGEIIPGIMVTKEDVMEMTFENEVQAYDWYNLYALILGFGIRRCNRRYFDPETKECIKSRIYVCARQGLRSEKVLYKENRKREHTRNTRCVCKARVKISRTSPTEPFKVVQFEPGHSHELSEPQCASNHRSHRKVSEADVELVRSLKEVGIKYCQSFLLMVKQAGGYNKLGYTQKDLYNKMASMDKIYSNEGDGQQTLMYIDSLKHSHYGVFREFRTGKNHELESVFWCDRRSVVDYHRFGDVLIFDATYKTNIYQKPFVILSGVNNHYQTTIFACAFLNDETAETYDWVLKCLMKVMNDKKPLSVITDGDLAMRKAIMDNFPEARHRLCSWHLCRNAQANLKLGDGFMVDFKKCLHSRKPEKFWHDDWHAMLTRWNIADRNWVQVTYMNRHLWAETYLKDHFFALQTTTSRCKSINSFVKDYMSYSDKLTNACKGFTTGVDKLRNNERKAHHRSDQSDPVITTGFTELERHAAEVFTENVFNMFRKQAAKGDDYRVFEVKTVPEESLDLFYVMRGQMKRSVQVVQCRHDNRLLRCTCFRWETSYMICKHMLFVLKQKGVQRIPNSLIAKRWTKTDKEFYRTEPSMKEPGGKKSDDPDLQAMRRASSRNEVQLYYSLGCTTGETMRFFREHMADGIRKMQRMVSKTFQGKQGAGTQGEIKKEENPYAHVKNPNPPDTKCPKGPKKDKRRRCGNCKELGHNRTTCPNPPVDSVEQVDDPEDDFAELPLEFDVKEEYFWSQSSSQSKKNKHE